MRWFRLWDGVLDDPKVQKLHPVLFRHWVNLLCLANQTEPRGALPAFDVVAFRLRLRPPEAEAVLARLQAAGLLDPCETMLSRCGVRPHNWEERQRASDNIAARVRAHRRRTIDRNEPNVTLPETLPAAPVEHGRNVTVTALDTEEIYTLSNESVAADADAPPAAPAQLPLAPTTTTPVPKPAKDKPASHPAVAAYRRATGISPREPLRLVIEQAVGIHDDDVAKWAAVLTAWTARGFSGRNVDGMLDWFKGGIPPPAGRRAATPNASTNNGAVVGGHYVQPQSQQRQRDPPGVAHVSEQLKAMGGLKPAPRQPQRAQEGAKP